MARALSSGMLAAIFSQETEEVPVCLLTITHETLSEPVYVSSNPTDRISDDPLIYSTTSRGNEYLFLPFDFVMPEDRADGAPRVQLTIENIDRTLVNMLRSISTPATINVEIVLASSPDIVEVALPALQMGTAQIGDKAITVDLIADSLINEPFPAGQFTPGTFSGLF